MVRHEQGDRVRFDCRWIGRQRLRDCFIRQLWRAARGWPEPDQRPVVSGAMLKPEVTPMPRSLGAEASKFSSPFVTTVMPHIGKPRIPQERFAIPKDRDALTRELQKKL